MSIISVRRRDNTWYLRVVWSHDFVDEPVELFSEVGPDGYENEAGTASLGEVPITTIDEIRCFLHAAY